MHINQLVEEVLSPEAVELLDALAARAIVSDADDGAAIFTLPVEADDWNATLIRMREIFDAEITVSGEQEWLGFRILQSFGVRDGQIAYQFTPTFAQALST